ncbi:MAG: 16S rRNA (uracil(1498)-N(3))-methyltransferase [Nocardioides sp.]
MALTDGRGRRAVGTVGMAGRRVFEVRVDEVDAVARPAPRLTVVQGLPKSDRGERAVEVLTEIGVDEIVPWSAARSVAVWKGDRVEKGLARWRATAREAAKQARRTWFPTVTDLATTRAVAERVAAAPAAYVLHEGAAAALAAVAEEPGDPPEELLLVVGPEGGVTPEELAAYVDAGARAVRLGPEVLRTSTAGLAAAAALLARTPLALIRHNLADPAEVRVDPAQPRRSGRSSRPRAPELLPDQRTVNCLESSVGAGPSPPEGSSVRAMKV